MVDSRFFLTGPPLTPDEAARIAGAELLRREDALVRRAADIAADDLSGAVVFSETKDAARMGSKTAALWLLPRGGSAPAAGSAAESDSPKLGFCRIAAHLHKERKLGEARGIDARARIGERCRIHETAVIGADAQIGDGSSLGPWAVIGPGVVLGAECEIACGVSIVHSLIGRGCAILPGAAIGQAGFGFVSSPDGPVRVPQLGRVIVGEDVEIGANTTIDRGALGDTVIASGVKIDNLVQIGHNVRIGRFSVIAAQTGVSGSTVIGDGVMIGGQVGLADHLNVGDGAQLAAQSGHMRDVPAGAVWGGTPARPVKTWFREAAALARLARRKSEGQ